MALVFIIGTGRCGSTMVQEILSRHSDVGFVSNVDSRFPGLGSLGRWNNSLYQRTPLRYTQRDRRRISGPGDPSESHFGPSEGYKILARRVSPLVSAPFRDLTADDATPWLRKRFKHFFEERMRAQGKSVFIHKFTGWPRARFIHEVFPEAKFLHVIRDGRAVASSLVQRPWWQGYRGVPGWGFGYLPATYEREWEESERDFVVLAALEWKLLIDAHQVARSSMPAADWLEVRYEDFVRAPRERLSGILDYMGLDWTDEFESKFAKFAVTSSKRTGHLRELTQKQVDMLEAVLQTHLEMLGYSSRSVHKLA